MMLLGMNRISLKILPLIFLLMFVIPARAQLLKQGDYGVGVTITIYQYDDVRSKPFPLVSNLKMTATTPGEEIENLSRSLGVEEVSLRYVRAVGLREGEAFTDTQPMNDRPFTFTVNPRLVTKGDLTIDFVARYGDKVLLEVKSVTTSSYDTLVLRGQPGGFAVREFKGPQGMEKVPETRGLLVTITPVIQNTRSLQNKPSDISRPTDQFGSKVVLDPSDIFVMPALIARVPINFAPGSRVQGSITLEGIVTPEGRITNVRILDTPDPALNPKVIEAFRQYRFTPAQLNGRNSYATYRETILLGKPAPL